MTPIQWALVELPYLSQDFVIVLALIYLIVGMVTVFIVPAISVIADYGSDNTGVWWELPLAIVLAITLWPYFLLWFFRFTD
jgi:hypothetical protein